MITSKELQKINFNSKPNSLDPARQIELRFVVHELVAVRQVQILSLILKRNENSSDL